MERRGFIKRFVDRFHQPSEFSIRYDELVKRGQLNDIRIREYVNKMRKFSPEIQNVIEEGILISQEGAEIMGDVEWLAAIGTNLKLSNERASIWTIKQRIADLRRTRVSSK